MSSKNLTEPCYVFAYGSLIWRPGFEFAEVRRAVVHGFERRFWQASHDHRGTPDKPGRVVTLVPLQGGQCEGLVYRLPNEQRDEILAQLDIREQDGYERVLLSTTIANDDSPVETLTWLAASNNPSWAGEMPLDKLAKLIASRQGPSGSNREYLTRLHTALRELGIDDVHVGSLVRELQKL